MGLLVIVSTSIMPVLFLASALVDFGSCNECYLVIVSVLTKTLGLFNSIQFSKEPKTLNRLDYFDHK